MDRLGVDYSKKSPYLWYFETAEELAKVYEDYLKSSEQAPVDEVGAENDGVEDDVSQKGLDVEAEFTVEEQRIQDFIDAALGKEENDNGEGSSDALIQAVELPEVESDCTDSSDVLAGLAAVVNSTVNNLVSICRYGIGYLIG